MNQKSQNYDLTLFKPAYTPSPRDENKFLTSQCSAVGKKNAGVKQSNETSLIP